MKYVKKNEKYKKKKYKNKNYSKPTTKDQVIIYLGSILTSGIILFGMTVLIPNLFPKLINLQKLENMLHVNDTWFTYVLAINLTTIIMYGFDKIKAITGEGMRVPELVLHVLEGLGGTVGAILAQIFFSHKKSKAKFFRITWIILILQVTILFFPFMLNLPGMHQSILAFGIPSMLLVLFFYDQVKTIVNPFLLVLITTAIIFIVFFISRIKLKEILLATDFSDNPVFSGIVIVISLFIISLVVIPLMFIFSKKTKDMNKHVSKFKKEKKIDLNMKKSKGTQTNKSMTLKGITSEASPIILLNKNEIIIGRSQQANVVLKNPFVSVQHLSIKLNEKNKIVVKDLSSSNGTYIDGKKLDPYVEYVLNIGERLLVGSEDVVYTI